MNKNKRDALIMDAEDTEWQPNNDGRKRYTWTDEEVSALLQLMKESGINKSLSLPQLANMLVRPIRNMGFNSTPYQIKLKLKNMRKSYLQCKRRGCTPAALKECPHYETLSAIYKNINIKTLSDTDNEDAQQNDDQSNIWSEQEIKTMLSIIEELNLAHELSLSSFSLGALRLISKGIKLAGFERNVEHVKTALLSLKTSYIESRKNLFNGDTSKKCPYYEVLDEIWGADNIDDYIMDGNRVDSQNQKEKRKTEFWSEEETIVLLTSIEDMNLIDEAFKCTYHALSKLHEVLTDSGYVRSKRQIKSKLANLKQSYIFEKRSGDISMRRFPFFNRYESLFGSYFNNLNIDQSKFDNLDETYKGDTSGIDGIERKRSPTWSEEETIVLLALVQELNLMQEFKERMTVDIASKLIAPMMEHGFNRTADQIKIKLKNLRSSYHRCIQTGCTSRALADCPFFNRLHAIFQNRVANKRSETGRRHESAKRSYVNVTDVSCGYYTDPKNKSDEVDKDNDEIEKSKLPGKDRKDDIWLSVETIKDDIVVESSSRHDEAYRTVEYLESDEESDISHMTGFEEVDEKQIFEQNNMNISLQDLSSEDDDMEPLLLEERSPNAQGTKRVEEEMLVINPDSSMNSLKRKHSPETTKEKLLNENKRAYRLAVKSPFSKLLGSKDISEPTTSTHIGRESLSIDTIRLITSDILKHEKWIQRQHHIWMEKQFEIQRKHDREQRELLLNELRELRRTIVTRLRHENCNNS